MARSENSHKVQLHPTMCLPFIVYRPLMFSPRITADCINSREGFSCFRIQVSCEEISRDRIIDSDLLIVRRVTFPTSNLNKQAHRMRERGRPIVDVLYMINV
ncbi:hypothetical protein BDV95DRAFT_262419 [Massariosphaeria phaeospora]|uniref:Uncharacterized protein n=1 Tax=Massariosphaeria phaeospora TaxID=100035 RepID=A0A7C8I2G6_9PLEO|nr:hypothetical protein BDV95DRAFT_262419 [Massariosphaeria phaeospora]